MNKVFVLYGLAGAVALGAGAYAARRVGQSASAIGGAINPLSDQNVAYRGANAVVSNVTGRDETVGGWLYDWTHPPVFVPTVPQLGAPISANPPLMTGGATGGW
jgi:hypothetical protein